MILNNFDDDDSPTNVSDSSNANLPSSHKRQRGRRIVIEDFTKLFSNSKLWDLVMRFYDQNGVSSCADGIVPHFISFQAMLTSDERMLNCFVVFFEI